MKPTLPWMFCVLIALISWTGCSSGSSEGPARENRTDLDAGNTLHPLTGLEGYWVSDSMFSQELVNQRYFYDIGAQIILVSPSSELRILNLNEVNLGFSAPLGLQPDSSRSFKVQTESSTEEKIFDEFTVNSDQALQRTSRVQRFQLPENTFTGLMYRRATPDEVQEWTNLANTQLSRLYNALPGRWELLERRTYRGQAPVETTPASALPDSYSAQDELGNTVTVYNPKRLVVSSNTNLHLIINDHFDAGSIKAHTFHHRVELTLNEEWTVYLKGVPTVVTPTRFVVRVEGSLPGDAEEVWAEWEWHR